MQFITGSQFGFDTLGEITCNPDHYYRRMWCAMQFDSVMTAADTNMDTSCTSPDNIIDSRKRPLEKEVENSMIKKHFTGDASSNDGMYHLKLLIPSVAAGAIIGKGGETIAQLQREKHARVKMSKANDFYPGTSERVCIISSNTADSIMSVLTFIMEKIKEKPEVTKPVVNVSEVVNTEREKQVKILVPNTTAGMIIGKGGSFIKQIKEQTGAYIQLSQKPKDICLPERCITVSGDIETNTKVCQMILQKIIEDPQSGSCPNLSYADVTGPVANFNPTGSPYATKQMVANGVFTGGGSNTATGGNSLNLCLNMPSTNSSVDNAVTAKLIENVNLVLHSSGFNEHSTGEILAALTILARYGMLGVGYGLNGSTSPPTKSINNILGGSSVDLTTCMNAGNLFGPIGSAITSRNAFDLSNAAATATATALDLFHPSQFNLNNNNCLELSNELLADNEIKKIDIEIPDAAITAILGPNGSGLIEIQIRSGTAIQIGKKSIYPSGGGSNRIISISGTQASITTAQILIEQRIAEFTAKR